MAEENVKSWEYKAVEIIAIHVEVDSGDITLKAAESPLIKAEVAGDFNPEKCEVTAEVKGTALFLKAKAKKGGFFRKAGCKAGFNVSAPAGSKLEVDSGAGNVLISGFSAGARLSSGAGAMEFRNLSGPINIKNGAGTIKGDIYSEDFEAKSGAGSLDISWNKSPQKGKADIQTGVGAINLIFPGDGKINVSYKSGVGSLNNELGSDPSAGFKVEVKSGAGSLNIKKR